MCMCEPIHAARPPVPEPGARPRAPRSGPAAGPASSGLSAARAGHTVQGCSEQTGPDKSQHGLDRVESGNVPDIAARYHVEQRSYDDSEGSRWIWNESAAVIPQLAKLLISSACVERRLSPHCSTARFFSITSIASSSDMISTRHDFEPASGFGGTV